MSLANSTTSFIQNVQDMLMDSFPVKACRLETACLFHCGDQGFKLLVAAGSLLKTGRLLPGHSSSAALVTTFLLEINQKQ